MMALVAATAFIGYVLVYAAVYNSGQYATQPWASVFPLTGSGG